jgi:hypothetical protein
MRLAAVIVLVVACGKGQDPADRPPPPHEDRHVAAVAPSHLRLEVGIGSATSVWNDAAFAAAPKLAGSASDGEARDTWSLRELVVKNVGPSVRVSQVIGAGSAVTIDAAAWEDMTRTPILHTTRRGTLKFRWADAKGAWGETVIRDVTRLELSR